MGSRVATDVAAETETVEAEETVTETAAAEEIMADAEVDLAVEATTVATAGDDLHLTDPCRGVDRRLKAPLADTGPVQDRCRNNENC